MDESEIGSSAAIAVKRRTDSRAVAARRCVKALHACRGLADQKQIVREDAVSDIDKEGSTRLPSSERLARCQWIRAWILVYHISCNCQIVFLALRLLRQQIVRSP